MENEMKGGTFSGEKCKNCPNSIKLHPAEQGNNTGRGFLYLKRGPSNWDGVTLLLLRYNFLF